jgi:hypothetical protein
MATDYVDVISRYDRAGLTDLWNQVASGSKVEGWPDGRLFEHLILAALKLESAVVTWPYRVELDGEVVEQIDGAVHVQGLHCLIEAKDTRDDINIQPIAKMRNQLLRRPSSTVGVVFSRSGFTEAAKVLTRYTMPHTVLLWEGSEFAVALEGGTLCASLAAKFRYAVEHGLPDYNIIVERSR